MSSSQLRTVLDTHLPLASFTSYSSVNTQYLYNICTMLDQRRRYINHAAMGLVAELIKKYFGIFNRCILTTSNTAHYYLTGTIFQRWTSFTITCEKKTSQNYLELGTIFNFELVRESTFGVFVRIIISFLFKKNLMTTAEHGYQIN